MFYERFCLACKEEGLKPTKVVQELGLSSGNMTNWKNGRVPKTEVALKIASYLGVSVDYLMCKTDTKNPVKPTVTDDDIKFALFGGDVEVTDAMYEEVKNFAKFVKERKLNG